MDRVEYKLFKRFLINKIKSSTPAFESFDDVSINIAQYHTLYKLFNERKSLGDDKVDNIIKLYLGSTREELDIEFINHVKQLDELNKTTTTLLQTQNITKRYMFLNSLNRPSRFMYFYFADAQCYVKDDSLTPNLNEPTEIDRDCIKMIPIHKYKNMGLDGLNEKEVRNRLGLTSTKFYLFMDTDKFNKIYGFNVDKFGGVFMVECAESDKFKVLCDMNILFLGSERPLSRGGIYLSERCRCWPKLTVDKYTEKKNSQSGGDSDIEYKHNENSITDIKKFWKENSHLDTEIFVQKFNEKEFAESDDE